MTPDEHIIFTGKTTTADAETTITFSDDPFNKGYLLGMAAKAREVLGAIGPNVPDHLDCGGCRAEWEEAIERCKQ